MKLNVKYFQDGGPVGAPAPGPGAPPPEGGAPAGDQGGQGGQDPLMQIAQILSKGLQAQDCQALAQGAQMFLQLISQAQSQGGGQGGPPPAEPTVMKKGGKFILKKKGENPFAKKESGKEEKTEMAKKGMKKC